MKKFLIVSLLGLLYATNINAQEDDDLFDLSLEELLQLNVTIGSKTIKNADQIPGAVTIIERDQIEQMKARNLRDILNVLVPGMDVVPTYFSNGAMVNSGIYSRGILSDFNQQILILYNGQNKFNETTFGSPSPGMLFTLENVERIEINTSPAPLMGGGALTTINIVTREQNLNGTEVFANTGFNADDGLQSRRFTVNHGAYLNNWHLGTSLQYFDDDGQAHPDQDLFGVPNGGTDLRDGVKSSINFLLNVKSPNEIVEIGTWYKNVNRDALFSNLNVSESSDLYRYQTSTLHNYIKAAVHSNIEVSAGLSLFDFTNVVNLDQPIPVGVNQRENVPTQTELSNYNGYLKVDYLKDYNFMGTHTLNAGVKFEREGQSDHSLSQLNDANQFVDVTDFQREVYSRDLEDDDRTITSLFAENNWNINDDLSLLTGFRYEYYQNFGNTEISAFNPRVAVAYIPTESIILKAQFSSAVRPPSIYEIQGNNFIPQLYGNQNVVFESLNTYEFSAKYRKGGFEVTINPYVAEFTDRISYVQSTVDNTSSIASNNGSLEVFGIEVSSRYQWKKNNYVFFNASEQDSEDGLTGSQTLFIPSTYVNGGVNLGWEKLNINLTGSYRGERELPANQLINQNKANESQLIVNSAIAYDITKNLSLYLQVQNLLDSEYFIPLGQDGLYVPLRQRTLNIGIDLSL